MWSGVGFVDKAYSGVYQSYKLADYLVAWRALEMHRQTCSFAGGYLGVVQMAVSIISSLQSPSGVSGLGVNYPALTDGALGFPVAFTTHLHLPFRVFTHPRPVPLIKARAMFTDSNRGKRECEIVFFLNNQRMVKVLSWLFMFFCSLAGSK